MAVDEQDQDTFDVVQQDLETLEKALEKLELLFRYSVGLWRYRSARLGRYDSAYVFTLG